MGARVIAVRAEPAEAAAGTTVTYTALQVSADGEITDAIDWAFCIERAPLASLGSVSVNCTLAVSDALVPFASGSIPRWAPSLSTRAASSALTFPRR